MKQAIIDFRKEIAALEVEQRNVKEQRKTVRFTGERTMSPSDAYYEAKDNKDKLRAMYAAYGLMRGKTFEQIENKSKPLNKQDFYQQYGQSLSDCYVGKHPLVLYGDYINGYLEKYGYQLAYEEKTCKTYWGEQTYREYSDVCKEIVRAGE